MTDDVQQGRPTKFDDAFIQQAEKLCRLGATDVELADFFDVDIATLYRWKLKHDGFCDAIKNGKGPCDDRVERSLYHRAVGNEDTPADTTAAIFWLKNRRPDDWRDRKEIGVGGLGGGAVLFENVYEAKPDK